LKWNPALLHGKRVEPVYGPLRRFNKESDREMSEQGQCEKETESKLKKFIAWHIGFEEWAKEMGQKDQMLAHIVLELAKRIDTQEQRLILLENRVYKGDSSPPCE